MKTTSANGSLSSRRRTRIKTQVRNVSSIENKAVRNDSAKVDTANAHSDGGRLQTLLENLDIRFVDCTFSYKLSHFESELPKKKRSKLAAFTDKVFNSIERVRESITSEKTYDQCLFFPINEKEKVKNFVHENFSDVKLSFINCKFIKRSTTFREKIAIKLRNIFGIQFELEYIGSTSTINHYTFRLKDILFANNHIQERIIEEA